MWLDGRKWNIYWEKDSFKEKAEIINGDESGRLQGDKDMYLEFVGTFYNCSGTLVQGKDCTNEEWNEFYDCLCNPVNRHSITTPHNNGSLSSTVYISSVSRTLYTQRKGFNDWGRSIDVEFVTISSQWKASQGAISGFEDGVIYD